MTNPTPYAPVYSYVPKKSLSSVLEHGLHGNKTLLQRPELLAAVAEAKGIDPEKLRANMLKTQGSYRKDVHEGPNVMFSGVPESVQLSEQHPLRQGEYEQVQIDLDALMRDQPGTRAFGIELDPEGKGSTRRRFITESELRAFQGQKPEDLWQHYADPDNVGYYAANVPHASIHTPEGGIDPKYLSVAGPPPRGVKEASAWTKRLRSLLASGDTDAATQLVHEMKRMQGAFSHTEDLGQHAVAGAVPSDVVDRAIRSVRAIDKVDLPSSVPRGSELHLQAMRDIRDGNMVRLQSGAGSDALESILRHGPTSPIPRAPIGVNLSAGAGTARRRALRDLDDAVAEGVGSDDVLDATERAARAGLWSAPESMELAERYTQRGSGAPSLLEFDLPQALYKENLVEGPTGNKGHTIPQDMFKRYARNPEIKPTVKEAGPLDFAQRVARGVTNRSTIKDVDAAILEAMRAAKARGASPPNIAGAATMTIAERLEDPRDLQKLYTGDIGHRLSKYLSGELPGATLPVEQAGLLRFKTSATRKERDIELWHEYNRNPSSYTLRPLMQQIDPVIQVEVNKWSGAIARPVLEAKAKALALEAIKTYDPNRGVALATHVTNRLKKLSRKVYTHQDAVRLPEYKKLKVQSLHKANNQLMDVHGREATNQELSDHLGWSPRMLSNVQQSQHAELIQSEDVGAGMFEQQSVWGSDSEDGMVDMVYFDMEPTDKLIFEHSTGYSGKPILSNSDLRRKTGLTQGQLSYRKRQMVDRLKDHMA